MSIRLKLIIAYFIMVAFSILALILGMIKVTSDFFTDLSETSIGEHAFEDVFRGGMNVLVDVEYMAKYEPELFEDPVRMKEVEGQTEAFDIYMFIEKDGRFIYKSAYDSPLDIEAYVHTLDFSTDNDHFDENRPPFDGAEIIIDDDLSYTVLRHRIPDGYVYAITKNEVSEVGRQFYGGVFKWIIMLVILVLVFMTLTITKMVIEPLNQLEKGTQNIRQGNLDFSIKSNKSDEIGRVMNAFDTMREELKASIEQQLLYEENRKELITSISHDLKTPITSIKGYVEGIRDGVANDEEKLQRYLEVIYDKSVDLDRLIDDLFLFSKLDLNRVPFNFDQLQAKRFFDDSYDEFKLDLDKAGFEFDYDNTVSDQTKLRIDAQQFKRVMTNIMSNAQKYSEEIKHISLKVSETEEAVHIAIKDQGKGIDPKDVDHIFDKFYRCDPSRNTDIVGSGLGLAIAKQIIDQHKGSIKAESEMGRGTTITISLMKNLGGHHE